MALAVAWGEPCPALANTGACAQYLALAREAETTLVTSRDELLAQLGEIDTPSEAVMLVLWDDYGTGCDPNGGVVREVADGYEVVASRTVNDCPITSERYRLHVSRRGAVTTLGTQRSPPSDSCF